jgi:phospholipid/cholesterol/gamma-HCH transport system substrate-binding protein
VRKLIPVLLVGALALVAVLALTGGEDKYVLYVKANDAGGVLKNYNVKVGEVAAGKITDISLDKQDHAVLKMELDKGAYPIGEGATAAIRPVNLLGEKYIDLNPGDLSKPVKSGSVVPADRTTTPVELDDALNVLDPSTRAAMRILINESGLAMAGRGADFNQTLTDLPPALDAAKRVVTEVDQENVKLRSLITQGDRVLATVSPKSDKLGDLVASAADALQTAAQRRASLGETVQTAPAALNALRGTLVKLQAASGQLSPAADDLRATAPQLEQTLKRLPAFQQDASATLAEVKRVSPQLSRLGRQSTPTLRVLRPTVNRLSQFTADIKPFLDVTDGGKGLKNFLNFVNGWTSVTSQKDQLGHVFRLRATVDATALTAVLERNGLAGLTGPTPSAAGKPAAPKKAATVKAAPAPSADPVKRKLTDTVKPVTGQLDKALKDVTGAVGGLLGDGTKGTGLLGGLTGSARDGSAAPAGGTDAGKILNYLLGP